MALDFTKPTTIDNYSIAFVPNIQANQIGLAQWLDNTWTTISSTVPTYSKHYNRSSGYIEEYSGTTWTPISMNIIGNSNTAITAANATSSSFATSIAVNSGELIAKVTGKADTTLFNNLVEWGIKGEGGNAFVYNRTAAAFTFNGNALTATNAINATNATNAANTTNLATGRTVSITGDFGYTSPIFNGSSNITAVGTLTSTGITASTYSSINITIDTKGRITTISSGTGVTTDTVLAAIASISVGVVGSYAYMSCTDNTVIDIGNTRPGSSLRYHSTQAGGGRYGSGNYVSTPYGGTPGGTWMLMGHIEGSYEYGGVYTTNSTCSSIWLRIS